MVVEDEEGAAALERIARDTPRALWAAFQQRFPSMYREAYHRVAADTQVLPAQRRWKILDERWYLSERLLDACANEVGILSSASVIEINEWSYTLIRTGSVGLIQCYIKSPGEMPKHADFRKKYADINDFTAAPQLPLGDIPEAFFNPLQINGIIVHSPIGKEFTEQDQSLGFLSFAIPKKGCNSWYRQFTMPQLISAYENKTVQRDIARPMWKRQRKDTTE